MTYRRYLFAQQSLRNGKAKLTLIVFHRNIIHNAALWVNFGKGKGLIRRPTAPLFADGRKCARTGASFTAIGFCLANTL
ncbi:MAG: hypothetical protein KDE19_22850 [Caldilineaceae bacterium]|nr:hypothetical protein [Caldilineaceae bacterium]